MPIVMLVCDPANVVAQKLVQVLIRQFVRFEDSAYGPA